MGITFVMSALPETSLHFRAEVLKFNVDKKFLNLMYKNLMYIRLRKPLRRWAG